MSEYTNRHGQTADQRALYEQAGPDLSLVRVIEAEPGHYGPLGELTVRAYEPVMPELYSSNYAETLTNLAERATDQTVFVALFGDFAIGGVTYLSSVSKPAEGYGGRSLAGFDHLAVDPSAQGLGAGRALVDACVAKARQDQRDALFVTTGPLMASAQFILESAGFTSDSAIEQASAEGLHLTHLLTLD